jgi:hypothetical protein
MAERSTGLTVAIVVFAALVAASLTFMFAMWVEADEAEQVIEAAKVRLDQLKVDSKDASDELKEKLATEEKKKGEAEALEEEITEYTGHRRTAKAESEEKHGELKPAVDDLERSAKDKFDEILAVDEAMKESRRAFEDDERNLQAAIRVATERLVSEIRRYEEILKGLNTDINQLKAKLSEIRARLKRVSAEALRRDTISDACGEVIEVGDARTNFLVVGIGSADRIRKGLKFNIWTLRRGYGLGWVTVPGRNFVKEGILPGDWLTVGRGRETTRYQIVSVGISREAEEKGLGLARHPGNDTIKVLGPGVTASFSVAGEEWVVEKAMKVAAAAESGVDIKGMIEIVNVRSNSSDAVILPERYRMPVCPQCGWEAYEYDAKFCPFCFLGDNNNEVQPLDESIKVKLNKAQNPFQPIQAGDRLSNPLFSPNRPLIFVLGSEMVKQSRQEMSTFIEENGGRVVDPIVLLTSAEEIEAGMAVHDVLPYEVNFLMPGTGSDAENLLKRARELGIRVMREDEVFEFFGELH